MTETPQTPDETPAADAGNTPPAAVKVEELLKGHRELLIEHRGEMYRLQITRRGRLILRK